MSTSASYGISGTSIRDCQRSTVAPPSTAYNVNYANLRVRFHDSSIHDSSGPTTFIPSGPTDCACIILGSHELCSGIETGSPTSKSSVGAAAGGFLTISSLLLGALVASLIIYEFNKTIISQTLQGLSEFWPWCFAFWIKFREMSFKDIYFFKFESLSNIPFLLNNTLQFIFPRGTIMGFVVSFVLLALLHLF